MDTFITEVVKQGGGYILGALAIIMLNEVWKARLSEMKDRLTQERDDKALLILVIQGNAAALSDFRGTLAQLKDVMVSLVTKTDSEIMRLEDDRTATDTWRVDARKRERKAKESTTPAG